MNNTEIIINAANSSGHNMEEFYPTPPELAQKMLEGIDWDKIDRVLEPSAGKGDLVKAVASACWNRRSGYDRKITVDCIEIEPYLRSVLKYEFSADRIRELRGEKEKITKKHYTEQTESERQTARRIEQEIEQRRRINMHIVHDDFLTFTARDSYDLILMNPPFSNGDAHLLKAIQLAEQTGGQIRCLLNAETVLNPYTNRRKVLAEKIAEHKGTAQLLGQAFADAERTARAEIALVKIDIPYPARESEIFSRLTKAAQVEEQPQDITDLAVTDFLEQIVTRYHVECDAGLQLIREYRAMQPYIVNDLNKENKYSFPMLRLYVDDDSSSNTYHVSLSENAYLCMVRRKYWRALFSNKEFTGKLTSNLQKKYRDMVTDMGDYEFSLFNIRQIMEQMNAEMNRGVEQTILALFEQMTDKHSWYPECAKNIHYFNGWKSNKAHKINKKVILPVNGMFSDYSWSKTFEVGNAEATISDIEKVFDFLDYGMTSGFDLHGTLERARIEGKTRNIPCKYFDVDLYKKGTMHIKFKNMELLDRFNIYCSRKKNWLPPNYGRTSYVQMQAEERAVVDSFNGTGEAGSGAAAYAKVFAKSEYYLGEPHQQLPAIAAAV